VTAVDVLELLAVPDVATVIVQAGERAQRAHAALLSELMKAKSGAAVFSAPTESEKTSAPDARARPRPQHRESTFRGKTSR